MSRSLLAVATVAGAELTVTGLSLGSMKWVELVVQAATNLTSDTEPAFRASVAGSFLTGASDYGWGVHQISSSASANLGGATNADRGLLSDTTADWGVSATAGRTWTWRARIYEPGNTTRYKLVQSIPSQTGPTGNIILARSSIIVRTTSALDGFKLFMNSGSGIGAGKLLVYGVS